MNITIEQGKTLKSARADVLCGLGILMVLIVRHLW